MIDCAISMGSTPSNSGGRTYGYYDKEEHTIKYGYREPCGYYKVPEYKEVNEPSETQKYWEEKIRPVALARDCEKMKLIYEIMKDHSESPKEDLQMINEILVIADIMHSIDSHGMTFQQYRNEKRTIKFYPQEWIDGKLVNREWCGNTLCNR